jgi:hypothetical protein
VTSVRFLRGTILGTGLAAGVGDVVSLDEATAAWFVANGRAVFVNGETLPPDPGIVQAPESPKAKAARTR